MSILFHVLLLLSGVALIVCSLYLLGRAGRCELSTRAGVALLLGIEGAISLAIACNPAPVWWGSAVYSALTASIAWLVIGTRYGRRCAHIDSWGITRPDSLPVEPWPADGKQAHD